jgi:hypothetical protein
MFTTFKHEGFLKQLTLAMTSLMPKVFWLGNITTN